MFILELYQEDSSVDLALFESLEEGQAFVREIPGYEREEVEGFTYEFIQPDQLPDYVEVVYNQHRVPFTRFMFPGQDRIDINWKEVPNLSPPGQGLVAGTTRVDAYSIDNADLQTYLEKREAAYQLAQAALTSRGLEVTRSFLGSEDGEAILYRTSPQTDWHFLTHLDPCFVESPDPEAYLAELLEELDADQ
ncbi:MAG: hypothetical protein SPK23_03055 [Eubacteriales bacterium]|nr:hypothetical protein [Clostridiales bacterium]MDY5836089.1 hypothetical protein [Eubacteriales bacterium]